MQTFLKHSLLILSATDITTAKMASGFRLASFLCLTGGLLISGAMSAPVEKETSDPCCPPGWTQYGSRCFIYRHSPKTWTDAELMCISIGGNLASVRSENENNFLRDIIYMVTGSHTRAWIGSYDAVKEKTWLWSNGSKFDYRQWGPGQPDNAGGNEHCIEMNWAGGYWNDHICHLIKPYVCSKDASH